MGSSRPVAASDATATPIPIVSGTRAAAVRPTERRYAGRTAAGRSRRSRPAAPRAVETDRDSPEGRDMVSTLRREW